MPSGFLFLRDEPTPLPKDRGTVIAQAVGGSPTGDVRGAPTSLVGDGPSAGVAPHQTACPATRPAPGIRLMPGVGLAGF